MAARAIQALIGRPRRSPAATHLLLAGRGVGRRHHRCCSAVSAALFVWRGRRGGGSLDGRTGVCTNSLWGLQACRLAETGGGNTWHGSPVSLLSGPSEMPPAAELASVPLLERSQPLQAQPKSSQTAADIPPFPGTSPPCRPTSLPGTGVAADDEAWDGGRGGPGPATVEGPQRHLQVRPAPAPAPPTAAKPPPLLRGYSLSG